ncbi:MAG TPA: hypothetical protein VN258_06525 [Mobilitalea sp.]|nr:hypothetical protein [Mobilitalea sp.]
MEERNPTFQEVQSFFNEEYAFLKKWIAVKEPDWDKLLEESRELERKHPFKYCLDRIVSTVELIDHSYMERKCNDAKEQ